MKKFLQVSFTVVICFITGCLITKMGIADGDNVTPFMFWGWSAFWAFFFFTFTGGWSNAWFNPYGD